MTFKGEKPYIQTIIGVMATQFRVGVRTWNIMALNRLPKVA
jgi:hypothetical protein